MIYVSIAQTRESPVGNSGVFLFLCTFVVKDIFTGYRCIAWQLLSSRIEQVFSVVVFLLPSMIW